MRLTKKNRFHPVLNSSREKIQIEKKGKEPGMPSFPFACFWLYPSGLLEADIFHFFHDLLALRREHEVDEFGCRAGRFSVGVHE